MKKFIYNSKINQATEYKRLVDLGPSADSMNNFNSINCYLDGSAIAKFTELWGDLVTIRRFKDGYFIFLVSLTCLEKLQPQ